MDWIPDEINEHVDTYTLEYMLQLVKAFLVHAIIIVVFSWF